MGNQELCRMTPVSLEGTRPMRATAITLEIQVLPKGLLDCDREAVDM